MLQHPGIISIKDVKYTDTLVYIFLSRITGGELFDYIMKQGGVKEHEAKFMFYQILRAMKYLHDRRITHRDLKPENLLLETPTPFSRVIITDFGMAKLLERHGEKMKTRCGTLDYLAPEILLGNYSQKVDIWSLGVLLYAMLSGKLPFDDASRQNLSFPTCDGWNIISEDVQDLIAQMLNLNPEARPSIADILMHPWILKDRDTLAKLYAKVLIQSQV
jgi:serine/threonine protein kinase